VSEESWSRVAAATEKSQWTLFQSGPAGLHGPRAYPTTRGRRVSAALRRRGAGRSMQRRTRSGGKQLYMTQVIYNIVE
jgi:hypothetical protein